MSTTLKQFYNVQKHEKTQNQGNLYKKKAFSKKNIKNINKNFDFDEQYISKLKIIKIMSFIL